MDKVTIARLRLKTTGQREDCKLEAQNIKVNYDYISKCQITVSRFICNTCFEDCKVCDYGIENLVLSVKQRSTISEIGEPISKVLSKLVGIPCPEPETES